MNATCPTEPERTYYRFEEMPESFNQNDIHDTDPQLGLVKDERELFACVTKAKTGFWRRQFNGEVTSGQRKFDWIFGVTLPSVCFFFDPIVFNSTMHEPALLGVFKPAAYALSFATTLATMAWLIWGTKLKLLNAFMSGLFALAAAAALFIGLAISPYSLLGLVILIGALGFTPLFSAFVYWRNSVRAYNAVKPMVETDVAANSWALGFIASGVIPYVFQIWWR